MRNQAAVSRTVIGLILFAMLLPAGARARASNSDPEVDRLLKLLVQKHLLTQQEAASVRAQAETEGQSAPATPPAQRPVRIRSAATSAPQPGTMANLQERAQKAAAKLPFRISGFGQVQWASLPGSNSTFRFRRARVNIEGGVGKLANYRITLDGLRKPALLDAYLRINASPYAKLTLGQFKVPFSQENLRASSALIAVERSQVDSLVPGRDTGALGRDLGAEVAGTYNFSKSTGIDYAVGIFNGNGIDVKDSNNRKDVAMRLAIRPVQGLALAGDYYHGAAGATNVTRDRQGVEFAYTNLPLTLMGEFIWGRDGAIHKQGWYGLGAWRFSKQWEGVFRADGYNPNRSTDAGGATNYLGGFNWYFAPDLELQLNYGLTNKQANLKSLFLSQVQFKF